MASLSNDTDVGVTTTATIITTRIIRRSTRSREKWLTRIERQTCFYLRPKGFDRTANQSSYRHGVLRSQCREPRFPVSLPKNEALPGRSFVFRKVLGHLARGKRCIGAALIIAPRRGVAQPGIGMYDRTRALIARRAGSPRNRFPLRNGWALLHFYARQTNGRAIFPGFRFRSLSFYFSSALADR